MQGRAIGVRGCRALAVCLVFVLGCGSFLGEGSLSDQDLRRALMHRDRASLKLGQAQLEMAIREYNRSIALNPYDPEAHFGLGEALRLKGLHDEAEASVREAIRLDPEHHDARLNLAVLHLTAERWDLAIQETTRLLEDPTFLNPARALVNRGWAYYSKGELDRAESDLRDALDVDSAIYQTHLNLGIVLYDQGEVAESLKELERVLSILDGYGPGVLPSVEAETRFRIAQARVKLGQREQAVEQLRLASDRGGRGAWGTKAREYLSLLE